MAFGGPVAHIAMLEREVVQTRKWISKEKFMDLLGFTHMIPGPNSTQMMLHTGYHRSGQLGVLGAGIAFILPAFLITLFLSWIYVSYGEVPQVEAFFAGIQAVVIALISNALLRLAPSGVYDYKTGFIFSAAFFASLMGISEVVVIISGGMLYWLLFDGYKKLYNYLLKTVTGIAFLPGFISLSFNVSQMNPLLQLLWVFVKTGFLLFGSGYVLVAYLDNDLVRRLSLLSSEQLVDAIAIGEATPGPVLTTSTAVGYMVYGLPGAVLSTLAIFFPSFLMIGLASRYLIHWLDNPGVRSFLKGINAAVIAVMLVVLFRLGQEIIISPLSFILFAAGFLLLRFTKLSALKILGAAALISVVVNMFY